MKNLDMIRAAAIVPRIRLCDPEANAREIVRLLSEAEKEGAGIMLLPKSCLIGCSAGDLALQPALISAEQRALKLIRDWAADRSAVVILGSALEGSAGREEAAVVISSKEVHYATESDPALFEDGQGLSFGVVLSEGRLSRAEGAMELSRAGAKLIFIMSSGEEALSLKSEEESFLSSQSLLLGAGMIELSPGAGESTTDGVYPGRVSCFECGSLIACEDGLASESKICYADFDLGRIGYRKSREKSGASEPFRGSRGSGVRRISIAPAARLSSAAKKLYRPYERDAFGLRTKDGINYGLCERAFALQTRALSERLRFIGAKKAVLGVSGGLDSTLALLVSEAAVREAGLKPKDVIAVTLPGFGTSKTTRSNADALMERLKTDSRDISIVPAVLQHFKDIGQPEGVCDATYENAQARERTEILMDLAGREGGLVVGTGDMSEEALGWCTYNGDHMAMYNVNSGIPKTGIQSIVRWYAEKKTKDKALKEALLSILDTPISPELLPPEEDGSIAQKTEEKIGPYELHDFFLYHILADGMQPQKLLFIAEKTFPEYKRSEIKETLEIFIRRFFSQQFKRSCAPDGVGIFDISLSPRGGLRMPSDAFSSAFLEELK